MIEPISKEHARILIGELNAGLLTLSNEVWGVDRLP